MKAIRSLIVFISLLMSVPAWSQEHAVVLDEVVPNPAHAGEPVIAYLLQGFDCGYPEPATDQVTVEGNTVTLTNRVLSGCISLPPFPPYPVELGSFQPGTYTLVYVPTDYQGNPFEPQYVEFIVLAEPTQSLPISVPANSWFGISILVVVLGLIAGRHLTMRSSGLPGTPHLSTKRYRPGSRLTRR